MSTDTDDKATTPQLHVKLLVGKDRSTPVQTKRIRALVDAIGRAGLAKRQEDYERACRDTFASLDAFDAELSTRRYLGGNVVSDEDLWLFAILVRFDVAFYIFYKLNRQLIGEFEHLSEYLRDLFQYEHFSSTRIQVHFEAIKTYYANDECSDGTNPKHLVPRGKPDLEIPHTRYRFSSSSRSDSEANGTEEDPSRPRRAGEWVRPISTHRQWISADGSTGFKAESGRYHLYVANNCPWSHRCVLVRQILGLTDVISLDTLFYRRDPDRGWQFRPDLDAQCTEDRIFGSNAVPSSSGGAISRQQLRRSSSGSSGSGELNIGAAAAAASNRAGAARSSGSESSGGELDMGGVRGRAASSASSSADSELAFDAGAGPAAPSSSSNRGTTEPKKARTSASASTDDESASTSSSRQRKLDEAMAKMRAEEEAHKEEEEKRVAAMREAMADKEKELHAKRMAKKWKDRILPDVFEETAAPPAPSDRSASGIVHRQNRKAPLNELELAMRDKRFKEKVYAASVRYNVGYADTRGRRPTMEDKLVVHGAFLDNDNIDYVAVFDGHGGDQAAIYASKQLHTLVDKHVRAQFGAEAGVADIADNVEKLRAAFVDAFRECQTAINDGRVGGGTTALVALFVGERLFFANLGDCRAVLVRRPRCGVRATADQKPHHPEEEKRIYAADGYVTKKKAKDGTIQSRVVDMLAVSRSLGDNPLRRYLSCEPILHGPYNVARDNTASQGGVLDDDEVGDAHKDATGPFVGVVLACDGVWDELGDNAVAHEALRHPDDAEAAACAVRDRAYAAGSGDNISVVVIWFDDK